MPPTVAAPGVAFRLQCLGPVQLTGPGRAPVSLRTRKHLGLLFYLARRARPVARDELIDLFWSEDTEKLARHSLSQSCSLVNKLMGAEVIRTAGRDRLAITDGSVRLDVAEFERAVAGGDHEAAIALWRGSLFESCWIARAPNFERWLTDEREKLQRLFRRLVHARIESLRNAGDHQAMRDEAERLLQHDPLDEKAMQAYLEALTLLGDRSLALRRYGEFEARLRRELEAEPGASLRAWAKRARRSDGPPAPRERMPAPRISEITVLPAVQPFFGRTEEFAMLWRAWETAGTGRGAFIIIEGEAGIGKTALATKLVNQAHVAGGSVCFVKCYRTEKSVPFAPITALIRQLSRLPGFVALDPVWIGELTRLVPELRERYPNVPQPMAVDDAARHRLSDAAVNAALCVADEQPLMIIIDDLQDADEASLALLHYLGRQTPAQAVLFIGIVRSGAPLTEFERTFLLTASTAGFCRTLAIASLPERDIGRLIEQVLARRGGTAAAWLVKRISASCQGNPLAAIEATLATDHHRDLTVADQGRREVGAPSESAAFVESAVSRLEALPRQAQLVAQAVGVAGRPLTEYELGVVTKLGPAELSAAITKLEEDHFVRRAGPNIAFAHERYSAAVEGNLETSRANDLHLHLANLTAHSAATSPAMRYEAARHFALAGFPLEAREQATSAAAYADSVGAVRSKADALQLLRSQEEGLTHDQLHDLCSCYLHLNDLESLRSLCASSRAGSESIGNELTFYEIAADYQSGVSGFAEAERHLEDYLISAQKHSPCWREASVLLLRIADKTGHYDRVRSIARLLRRDGNTSHAAFGAAYVRLKYYWAAKALPLMQQALERARAEGALEIEQLARDGIGILLKQVGRYRESIQQFDYSLGLARKTMNPHAEVACLHNRAVSELCLGDWESVRASHTEAERIGAGFSRWGYHLFRIHNNSIVDLFSGEHERALQGFEAAYKECLRCGFPSLGRDAKAGSALVYQRMGRLSELHDAVAAMRALGESNQNALTWLDHAAVSYDKALNDGKPEEAIAYLVRRSRELERRDVSHQVALDFERIVLQEIVTGTRATNERRVLATRAEELEAGSITRQLANT